MQFASDFSMLLEAVMTDAGASVVESNDARATAPIADQSVTVLVEVCARPGHGEALTAELAAVARRWAQEPECTSVTVFRDTVDTGRFFVLEAFASLEALQAHQSAPATHRVVDSLSTHFTAPPASTTCHRVASFSFRSPGARGRFNHSSVGAAHASASQALSDDAMHAEAAAGRRRIRRGAARLTSSRSPGRGG